MARSIVFDVIADTRKFQRGLSQADRSATQFQRTTMRVATGLASAFAGVAVIAGVKKVVAAARESQLVAKQTEAVLKSTGGAAHLTAKQFADLANEISRKVGVDDEVIQSGENILATFTNVRNEVGRGNDVFNQATSAAVDMAAALGHGEVSAEGLQKANIQLGKALNDPIRGITALQRVGVTFSAAQREQIKVLVESGHRLEAQKIILAELRKEFGGSAEANATASKKLAVAWGNLQESLGKALLPAIDAGAEKLTRLVEGFEKLDEATHGVASKLAVGGTAVGLLGVEALITAGKLLSARKEWKLYRAEKVADIAVDAAVGTAEEGLAAKTVAAGAAAEAAAGKFKLLAGAGGLGAVAARLGVFGVAATVVGVSLVKLKDDAQAAADKNEEFGRKAIVGGKGGQLFAERVSALGGAHKTAAAATQQGTAATNAYGGATDAAAVKQAAAKAKVDTLTAALKEQKQGFKQAVEGTRDAIIGYDGLISKSKVTAAEVVKGIQNQVANFRTYAHDVQRLIRAGVNPAAIRELSQQGPQYVHALAVGSARQLDAYKKAWHDRQAAIKGSFAASMDQQFKELKRKIAAMQREIDKLHGKTVDVQARAKAKVTQGTVAWLRAAHVKIPQLAGGGRVTQGTGPTADDVLARLSRGETVVSARDSADPGFRAWARDKGIPGFAAGGNVGRLQRVMDADAAALRKYSQHGIDRLAGLLGSALGHAIDKAVGKLGGSMGPHPSVDAVAQRTATLLGRFTEWPSWSRRIMWESGGNWRAVNRWDSNWAAGHPSVGGAQVIRGTFAAHAGRFRNTGPFLYGVSVDPLANSYAGGHYAVARYGSLYAVDPRVRPRGYDSGGYLPPGVSMAVNRTGRPEPVGRATARQPIHITLEVNGRAFAEALVPDIEHARVRLRRR